MADDKASLLYAGEFDVTERNFPIPSGGSRFILPVALRQALQRHPLSCDLYTGAAGYYPDDTRRFRCPPSPSFLIYYCLGGEMSVVTDSRTWLVRSGDLVIIQPEMRHITDASKSVPCSYFWVSYFGELCPAYTAFINASELVVHLGLQPELIAQFEALCNLRTSNFKLDTFVGGACRLKGLLTGISLTLSQKTSRKRGRIDLERIRNFMTQHLDRSLNLEELAHSANLSPYHFGRTFKKLTGQSPMHYFTQMRIQQACYLLDTKHQSIKQVAYAVGYADPQYFSRIFRQIIGMTPHAYRNGSSSVEI